MAADWRALALEQAELISSRLRELLSSGQGYIRSEFGVELGLEPEIYPSWVILSTVAVGLLALAVLSWAAVCGGLLGGRKRGAPLGADGCEPLKAPAVTKAVKPDEQKKKSKKKGPEKKSQSNGRPVPEPRQEEAKGGVETSRPSPETRTEKVQAKKNKKKPKPEVKAAKTVSTAAGKEPDDGAWETKVSNREKRQQKRKDRGPDSSGSPGGVEAPPTYHLDPPTAPARLPVSAKKNREPLHPRTSVKGDAVILSVSSSRREEAVNGGGGWTDISMKMPSQISSSEGDKWPPMPKAPRHRNPLPNTEPPTWRQETEGSWSGADGRMKTDLNPVSFSVLSLSPTAEPLPLPSSDQQWGAPVDDQWSGFNGIAAADPSSDWNAPTELWGNYEEPPPPAETPAPPPQEAAPQPGKVSDDDDREDPASGGAAKSKRKKKKKKKAEEEGAPAQGVPESAAPPQSASLPRAQDLPPAPTSAKPGITPPSYKKPDQSAEPPKPSQKKKVRRET